MNNGFLLIRGDSPTSVFESIMYDLYLYAPCGTARWRTKDGERRWWRKRRRKRRKTQQERRKETEDTIRGHTISTEINQGCAQISKRKITKINRPDVRCDKKRDSRSLLFFPAPYPAYASGRVNAAIRCVVGLPCAVRFELISITPIVPIKFPRDKPGDVVNYSVCS